MGGMKMKQRILAGLAAGTALFGLWMVFGGGSAFFVRFSPSEAEPASRYIGEIRAVSADGEMQDERIAPLTEITVRLLTGDRRGEEIVIRDRSLLTGAAERLRPVPGELVIMSRNLEWAGEPFYITDRYRLPALAGIMLLFAAAAVAFGSWRGVTALLGLGLTAAALVCFIVPQIAQGADAVRTSVIGASAIAVASLYLAHGINRQTSVALGGTLITLAAAAGTSSLFVWAAKLTGLGSEESFFLRAGGGIDLDLQGILLGGIILGTLGILDDITVSQAAVVHELSRANPELDRRELYRRGLAVGREHIASLVNTLFLAYAGVALPFLIYIAVYQKYLPAWLVINGEPIAEEIVRTLAGSIALILAVPLTTGIAAWRFGRRG